MSTTVCSKCGTSLAAGAKSCPSCGQAVAARPAPPVPASASAGGKHLPLEALAVLGGGLVLLLGAFTLYKSNALSGTGGTTAPVTVTPAAQSTPLSSPPTPSASASPATSASQVPGTPSQAAGVQARRPAPAGQVPPAPAGLVSPAQAPPGRMPGTPASAAALPSMAAPVDLTPAGTAPPAPPPVSKTYETREYAVFNVAPDETIVTVDGKVIGTADDWDDMAGGKKYQFKGNGVHYVKLSLDDHKTVWLKFVVAPTAEHKTANVDLKMDKEKKEK